MRAGVLTVGTELLRGGGVDSNTAVLGSRLFDLGVEVALSMTVADRVQDVAEAVKQLGRKNELVVVMGGLGPTFDDVTRQGVSKALGRPLLRDQAIVLALKERYRDLGVEPSAGALGQADILEGAQVLPATLGTGPGQALAHASRSYVLLPGVPSEMATMLEDSLVPWLKERYGLDDRRRSRRIRLIGMIEAEVQGVAAPVLAEHPDVAWSILAYPEEIHVVLYEGAEALAVPLDRVAAEVEEALGDVVFGKDTQSLEAAAVRLLATGDLTVAVAESCTGGLVAKRITDVPGSSAVLMGGVVAYSDEAKQDWLSVSRQLLHEYGAVSSPVACEMAANVRLARRTTFGLAVTGVAGPSGGSDEKPVGLVYVAIADEHGATASRHVFPGARGDVRRRASQVALDALRRAASQRIAPGASPGRGA